MFEKSWKRLGTEYSTHLAAAADVVVTETEHTTHTKAQQLKCSGGCQARRRMASRGRLTVVAFVQQAEAGSVDVVRVFLCDSNVLRLLSQSGYIPTHTYTYTTAATVEEPIQ